MRERILFDGPSPKQNLPDYEFYAEGGSPKFTDFICDFIDQQNEQIEEINLALYLCNNKLMLESMIGSALKAGITLNIFSIPLEGYDKTPAQSPTFAPKLSKNKALQSKQENRSPKKTSPSIYMADLPSLRIQKSTCTSVIICMSDRSMLSPSLEEECPTLSISNTYLLSSNRGLVTPWSRLQIWQSGT